MYFSVILGGGWYPRGYMEGTWGAVDDYPIPTKEYDPFELPYEDIYAVALVIGIIRLE